MTEFKIEAEDRLQLLESMVTIMESAREEILKANEKFLIDLLMQIAKSIVLRELSTDREYVVRLVRHLVERTGVRENLKIRLHPEDIQTVGMLKEKLEEKLGQVKHLLVEPSTQVPKGGCAIETEWHAIEASVESQIAAISESLMGKGLQSDNES